MKLLYGTTNQAKLDHMKQILSGLDIEIVGLKDVGLKLDVDESGNNPLENARIKALAYYKATGMPVFSCDSGLYIEGLKNDRQPGVHVRRVQNKYLSDEEFIQYYSDFVAALGKETKAKFKNAICLVMDEKSIFEYDGDDISDNFIMTSKIHTKRKEGFPMDSISLDIETGSYFVDEDIRSKNEEKLTKGFREFFERTILE
jgi:8-oxo-dGTP diphosphatase